MRPFGSGFFCLPCCDMHQNVIPFHDSAIFRCTDVPHFVCPFIRPQMDTGRPFYKKKLHFFIWLCQFLVAAYRISSCSMWELVPWPWIKPGPPESKLRSLSHWTAADVPASIFWLLWIKLLWMWVYRYLFETLLSILLGIYFLRMYPEVQLLIILFLIFWGATILHFNGSAQRANVSIFPSTFAIFCFFFFNI